MALRHVVPGNGLDSAGSLKFKYLDLVSTEAFQSSMQDSSYGLKFHGDYAMQVAQFVAHMNTHWKMGLLRLHV